MLDAGCLMIGLFVFVLVCLCVCSDSKGQEMMYVEDMHKSLFELAGVCAWCRDRHSVTHL